jgi:hypothetical protein
VDIAATFVESSFSSVELLNVAVVQSLKVMLGQKPNHFV